MTSLVEYAGARILEDVDRLLADPHAVLAGMSAAEIMAHIQSLHDIAKLSLGKRLAELVAERSEGGIGNVNFTRLMEIIGNARRDSGVVVVD